MPVGIQSFGFSDIYGLLNGAIMRRKRTGRKLPDEQQIKEI